MIQVLIFLDGKKENMGFWDEWLEIFLLTQYVGHAVLQIVKPLGYKPVGRGFNSRGTTVIFHWHYPSGRTVALGSTQPLTEMSTRSISWGRGAVKAANR